MYGACAMYAVVELDRYGFVGMESSELKEREVFVFDVPVERELMVLAAIASGFKPDEGVVVLPYGEDEEVVVKPLFRYVWRGGEVEREGSVERVEEFMWSPRVKFLEGRLLGEYDVFFPVLLESSNIRIEYEPFYGVFMVTRKGNVDGSELAVLFGLLKSEYGV